MREIYKGTDLVHLGFLESYLKEAGFFVAKFDMNISILEGQIPGFEKRLMVRDEDYDKAVEFVADLNRSVAEGESDGDG